MYTSNITKFTIRPAFLINNHCAPLRTDAAINTQVYSRAHTHTDMHMQNTYRCACICTHTYTFRHEFSRAFLQYVIFNLSFKVILELIMLNVIYV